MAIKRKWLWMAAVAFLPLVAVGIAWAERRPIAKSMIDKEFAKRGVQASYRIREVGTKRQRIENIRIGDPASPDLIIDWAEINTSVGWTSATIKDVRLGGVRLLGKVTDGAVHFGAVDKLLPEPTGEPFKFPDIDLSLENASIGLSTEFGEVGLNVSGVGNPSSSLAAKVAGTSPLIVAAGCHVTRPKLFGNLNLVSGNAQFSGELAMLEGKCSSNRITRLNMIINGHMNDRFDVWGGNATFSDAQFAGTGLTANGLAGSFDFDGNTEQTKGGFNFKTGRVAMPQMTLGGLAVRGSYGAGFGKAAGLSLESTGKLAASSIIPDGHMIAHYAQFDASGTPIGPIAGALATAIKGLSKGGDANARYTFGQDKNKGFVTLSGLAAQSKSGAFFTFDGKQPVRLTWPKLRTTFLGTGTLAGGGFPKSRFSFDGKAGIAVISPMSAGGTRLALNPVHYQLAAAGLKLDTVATLDGSIGGGHVSGLQIPLAFGPGVSPLSGCHNLAFGSFALSGFQLNKGAIDLCLTKGEALITAPELNGTMGSTPVRLTGKSARIGFAQTDFTVDQLHVLLGKSGNASQLDMGSFSGRYQNGVATGHYAQGRGKLAAVALVLSDASGEWRLRDGVFDTRAKAIISDSQSTVRFHPLATNDLSLHFAGDRITASGILRTPDEGIEVAKTDIVHYLKSGVGGANLDTPSLTFGPDFQPEKITNVTKGVVEYLAGTISGKGRIDWTENGVTSSGDYRTESMDMAAAFGPVTGLKAEVHFTDLLGMVTAPDQKVQIFALNPGIAVLDGTIHYSLLPGLKAQIYGGRWPFLGGALLLEPTILDLNTAAVRHLTFKVEQMDMARFIAAMDFRNIAATGIYDGTLPMIFDKDGGKIAGGKLTARGGGTLAYVGEISNENLGPMGRFAFDALKSIKYNRLGIDLNGAVDGDVITKISFAGINQAPIEGIRAKFPLPVKVVGLSNFPFIFNVTITAKFRELFDMTRTIADPSLLIERLNPNLQRVNPAKTIQPVESGVMRKEP